MSNLMLTFLNVLLYTNLSLENGFLIPLNSLKKWHNLCVSVPWKLKS